GHAVTGRAHVAAVVDRAAAKRGTAEPAWHPAEAPGCGALRDVPRGAVIDRDLDARHDATGVGRRARDRDGIAALDLRTGHRRRCRDLRPTHSPASRPPTSPRLW